MITAVSPSQASLLPKIASRGYLIDFSRFSMIANVLIKQVGIICSKSIFTSYFKIFFLKKNEESFLFYLIVHFSTKKLQQSQQNGAEIFNYCCCELKGK